jgi:hypothetical protein
MSSSRILTWNGRDLPAELRELPAGRYVVAVVDDVPAAIEETDEDEELRQALTSFASLQASKGRTAVEVRQRIENRLRK